jgi:hypothetical protein
MLGRVMVAAPFPRGVDLDRQWCWERSSAGLLALFLLAAEAGSEFQIRYIGVIVGYHNVVWIGVAAGLLTNPLLL